MGDLVQTTPLLNHIHSSMPEAEIDLVINSPFRPITTFLPHLKQIYELPLEEYQNKLIDHETSLDQIERAFEEALAPIKAKKYDLIINLTHSSFANYLCGTLMGQNTLILGSSINQSHQFRITGKWMAYLRSVFLNREYNPFNLVDIYRHSLDEINPALLEQTELTLTNLPAPDRKDQPVCIIHPGASEPKKQWKTQGFASLAKILNEQIPELQIVLTGSKSESELANQFEEQIIVNKMGKTTLPELLSLIQSAKLVITNDTGIMHLAAALHIPVLETSTGQILFSETGPYGKKHHLFQSEVDCIPCSFNTVCPNQICKEEIAANELAHAAISILKNKPVEPSESEHKRNILTGINLYGFQNYQPLSLNASRQRHFMLQFYFAFWLFHMNIIDRKKTMILLQQQLNAWPSQNHSKWKTELLAEIDQLINPVYSIIQTLKKLKNSLGKATKQALEQEQFHTLENIFYEMRYATPLLKIYLDYFDTRLGLSDVPPENILSHYEEQYNQLIVDFNTMQDLLEIV